MAIGMVAYQTQEIKAKSWWVLPLEHPQFCPIARALDCAQCALKKFAPAPSRFHAFCRGTEWTLKSGEILPQVRKCAGLLGFEQAILRGIATKNCCLHVLCSLNMLNLCGYWVNGSGDSFSLWLPVSRSKSRLDATINLMQSRLKSNPAQRSPHIFKGIFFLPCQWDRKLGMCEDACFSWLILILIWISSDGDS